MRILKLLAWAVLTILPLWIVVAIFVAYVGLVGWLQSWFMDYDPSTAMTLIGFAAVFALLFLAMCIGWRVMDSDSLQLWCDRRAERFLQAAKASTRGK